MAPRARTTATWPRVSPVIFSDPMVLAILDGHKTQTRRIVRGGPLFHERAALLRCGHGVAQFGDSLPDDPVPIEIRCPYGMIGDRLWVREVFAITSTGEYEYRATEPDWRQAETGPGFAKWRTPIFMPRAASRITLELLEVRCQRLHDMTESDAVSEGVRKVADGLYEIEGEHFEKARTAFSFGWDGINGRRASWESNCFVWALTFRRVP